MTIEELPLGIDIHVHYRTPGHPQKETIQSGYNASLQGGIGTVIDMPNTDPPIDSVDTYNVKMSLLNDYPFIHQAAAITNTNIGSGEIMNLAQEANIFKLFMANSTGDLGISDEKMRKAFAILDDYSPLIIIHGEDPNLIKNRDLDTDENEVRPVKAEMNAINTILDLASDYPKINFHLTHVSSYSGASLLVDQDKVSWDCLHKHLQFDESLVKKMGNFAKMNPPLRDSKEKDRLYQLFLEDKIPIIASDHAPHTKDEKRLPVAGAPGAQELYLFLIDQWLKGKISKNSVKRMIYENPKQLLDRQNLDTKEGIVKINTDKNFIIDNYIQTKVNWSLWENYEFNGKIIDMQFT